MANYRVRLHDYNFKKGSRLATLAGIDYSILKQIVTCAELHCYEEIKKLTKSSQQKSRSAKKKLDDLEMIQYHKGMLAHSKRIREAIDLAQRATYPAKGALTKEERFAKVRESEKERRFREDFKEKYFQPKDRK